MQDSQSYESVVENIKDVFDALTKCKVKWTVDDYKNILEAVERIILRSNGEE